MTEHDHSSGPTPETPEAREQRFREEFQVGGIDRELSDEQQLEQLTSYFDAHYPLPDFTPPWAGGKGDPGPADRYSAHLPDRITHTAMLMLGSAVDHSMPGVAYLGGISTESIPQLAAERFIPSEPSGRWAASFHSGGWWRGSGDSLEYQWRPEVAAVAELSGTTILDLDYPLAPEHTIAEMNSAVAAAVEYARSHGASSVTGWGYSSGAALVVLNTPLFDAQVLTFPDLGSVAKLPTEIRGDAALTPPEQWPPTFVQIALQDEVASAPTGLDRATDITIGEYVSHHRISTPKIARQRIVDVAEYLRSV
ncbi:alpha/beta hydrolase [Corynebacterium pacaense]|uniref:alpha/beta hydrolase n=1 Tax=Corynebacterium pacaense TaxID=1816684 RepID=UPI0009BAEA9F|nr:alpha/beta hydrolase fold domain-containing protein [Corynebacterium pacaense]